MRSNLFTPKIMPFPASIIFPAMTKSWCVTPSMASINRTQMLASSMAFWVRTVDQNSMFRSIFPGFLRPAVSRNVKVWPVSSVCWMSMVSRVVPAMSDTMVLSWLMILLRRLLLPTFGRPTRASFIWLGFAVSSVVCGWVFFSFFSISSWRSQMLV